MAEKIKTKEISITDDGGTFNVFLKPFRSGESYDFDALKSLRQLLSNEKAKMVHLIRKKKPKSIYELAKMLNRDFKSVSDDIKLLEKFGFVEMVAEKTGKRERLKPVVVIDALRLTVRI